MLIEHYCPNPPPPLPPLSLSLSASNLTSQSTSFPQTRLPRPNTSCPHHIHISKTISRSVSQTHNITSTKSNSIPSQLSLYASKPRPKTQNHTCMSLSLSAPNRGRNVRATALHRAALCLQWASRRASGLQAGGMGGGRKVDGVGAGFWARWALLVGASCSVTGSVHV